MKQNDDEDHVFIIGFNSAAHNNYLLSYFAYRQQLNGDTPLVHRFVLGNTTETPLTMRFDVQAPFKILSTEPPPSAKSTRSQSAGSIIIKPAKTLEVRALTLIAMKQHQLRQSSWKKTCVYKYGKL